MEREIILKEQQNDVQIKNYVERYLNYIDVSENTVKTYNVGLKMFCEYITLNNIKTPTREDIIAFREDLKERLQPNTVNSYMIAVRNFYDWLEYEDITKNITKKIKGIKIGEEHKRESLTEEQVKLVLDNTKDIREKTLFSLLISCGLRANEIVNIELKDFKEKQGNICLYVLGKARDYKQDFVIIPKELFDLIKEYVSEFNITDYLFTSTSNHNTNGKLTTKTIRLMIKNMFKRVGIVGDEYCCHSCRHTFATLSLINGEDIREVQQAMRHHSISTTQRYLHDLDRLNNKCSNVVSSVLFS